MAITLRQLRYFQALARKRHFGQAAAEVAVTQPALSAQIRQMEAALGGPLVDRALPRLPLTPLGRALLPHADSVLAGVRALEEAARDASGGAIELALGIIPTVAPYLAPQLLPLVREGGGSVTIREAVTETLVAELREGVLDAAVMALPVPLAGAEAVALFEDRFLLALPPAALAPELVPVARPEQVAPDRLLLLDEGHCLADQALGACGLGRDRVRRFGAASLVTLARLVASGQGATLIPEIAAASEGRGLRLSRFAAPEPGRSIVLVRAGRGRAPAWFGALAGYLREAAARLPPAGL